MSRGLPNGWVRVPVAMVIEDLHSGFACGDKNVEGGVAHLRMNNIGLAGDLVLDLVRTIPEELAKPNYALKRGDVLVCTTNSGELVGKCAYFELEGRYAFSNHLTRLRPRPDIIDGSFLRWILWLQWRAGAWDDKCKNWVNQSTIPKEALLAHEIAVPPIREQRRIVDKLETLFAKVNGCRERLADIPAIAKRLRQSILADACSGRLTAEWRDKATDEHLKLSKLVNPNAVATAEEILEAPEYWQWLPLQAVCDPNRAVCYGVIKLGPEHSDGIPCLRTSDVKPLRINTGDVKKIAPEIADQYQRTVLRGGELLVNVRGTLGGVAVVPSELRGWNISREVALVPIQGVVPEFVCLWIASLPCQNWLTSVAKGVAYTGINIEDLRLLPIAIPSMAEQREIVVRAGALLGLADRIETRSALARIHIEKLTPSLLAKAFRGELVPTEADSSEADGREYESGAQLLAGIKTPSNILSENGAGRHPISGRRSARLDR